MTPEQIARVEATIAKVADDPRFAARFYEQLFTVAPEARAMFGDVDAQQLKLRDELASMVEMLRDLPALDARAAEIGARHRGYGVRAEHYRVARGLMVEVLVELLGEDFTAEDRAAWERATGLISELMQAR